MKYFVKYSINIEETSRSIKSEAHNPMLVKGLKEVEELADIEEGIELSLVLKDIFFVTKRKKKLFSKIITFLLLNSHDSYLCFTHKLDQLLRALIFRNLFCSQVMAGLFNFSAPVDIDIRFNGEENRKLVEVKVDKDRREKFPLYFDGETVAGKITIRPRDGKKIEHQGIKIEFVGNIELFYDRGNHYEFTSLVQELAVPGELRHPQPYEFEFKNVEKQYESYHGINVKLRYFVRVTISRRLTDIVNEKDIWVYSYRMPPDSNSSIKMEVGIEDCLHIVFEYNKSRYHLKDVIVGKIYFLLVRIKIKHMELSIIRRETTGAAPNQYNESETITKFEIMDGAPVRGETIPIRLFLGGFELTPTFRDVNKKFSTRYYLNLVLVDEENRRYFKQQEITIYRRKDDGLSPNDPK